GSHTDGGAFTFTVEAGRLTCEDKFGKRIEPDLDKRAYAGPPRPSPARGPNPAGLGEGIGEPPAPFGVVRARVPRWSYTDVADLLHEVEEAARDGADRRNVLWLLTLLLDRRYATGAMKRSCVLSMVDRAVLRVLEGARDARDGRTAWLESGA